jgi:transketolase
VELLDSYIKNGSDLAGHVRKLVVPGVECSAGSLGHGLPVATGIGYGNRVNGSPGRVFVLMGDGECNEGSVWEAAMLAAFHRLSNIVAIVDRNKLQSYSSDEKVLNMGDIGEKFRAFGWRTVDISGHDIPLLINTLQNACMDVPAPPMAVIAHTIKGKGVSFMENKLEWHFKSPNDEELAIGLRELMK